MGNLREKLITNLLPNHKKGFGSVGDLMLVDEMVYCLVCKDLAMDKRYAVRVSDTRIDNHLHGFICRHCYNKFIDSHHNKGFFKIAKVTAWAKSRRDSMRIF